MSTAGVNAAQRLYDERIEDAIVSAERAVVLLRQAAKVYVAGRWDAVGDAGRLANPIAELLRVASTLARTGR